MTSRSALCSFRDCRIGTLAFLSLFFAFLGCAGPVRVDGAWTGTLVSVPMKAQGYPDFEALAIQMGDGPDWRSREGFRHTGHPPSKPILLAREGKRSIESANYPVGEVVSIRGTMYNTSLFAPTSISGRVTQFIYAPGEPPVNGTAGMRRSAPAILVSERELRRLSKQ